MSLNSVILGLLFLFAALQTVRPKLVEAFVWINIGYDIPMKCLVIVGSATQICGKDTEYEEELSRKRSRIKEQWDYGC